MTFQFHFKKALQAAGILLKLDGYRMERIRLLKLLYIADREILAETGRPITGDAAVAMDYGPVLSRVYDLIKGKGSRVEEWSPFIQSDGHSVVLCDQPGQGELSRREVEKLTEVTERYRQVDDWALSNLTHEFGEWGQHFVQGTSREIPWSDALLAQGKAEMVELAAREAENGRILDDLFRA